MSKLPPSKKIYRYLGTLGGGRGGCACSGAYALQYSQGEGQRVGKSPWSFFRGQDRTLHGENEKLSNDKRGHIGRSRFVRVTNAKDQRGEDVDLFMILVRYSFPQQRPQEEKYITSRNVMPRQR